MKLQWYSTTESATWQTIIPKSDLNISSNKLIVTDAHKQAVHGFGGCFNEAGWAALQHLSETDRKTIMGLLFADENGLGFDFCRIPIGASDYALEWYSHNEKVDDLKMEAFSIERDFSYLIPYIRAAQDVNPQIRYFASPWSPPTWMKQPKAYNYGRLRMEPEILAAYALYFEKFVEAYADTGIPIEQVHIQNEPFADQKFPSCLWTSEQMKIFVNNYLSPLFKADQINTEIWLGTLNGPSPMQFLPTGQINISLYDAFVDDLLFDETFRKNICGVGYQWAGQHVIQRTHDSFPELRLMQTENECGDGSNTWVYAHYVFSLFRHYLANGCESYTYWNMVLETGGESTWGWHQNSLISVDPSSKTYTLNPEFHVFRHLLQFVRPGARVLDLKGQWQSSAVGFANPDGSLSITAANALAYARSLTLEYQGEIVTLELPPLSMNTFVIGA